MAAERASRPGPRSCERAARLAEVPTAGGSDLVQAPRLLALHLRPAPDPPGLRHPGFQWLHPHPGLSDLTPNKKGSEGASPCGGCWHLGTPSTLLTQSPSCDPATLLRAPVSVNFQ